MIKNIDTIKGISIISVICAHSVNISNNSNSFHYLFGYFGLIGAPLFFIISGYLFLDKNDGLSAFLLRKRYILTSWLFIGTFVYIISSLFGNDSNKITVESFLLFIIGFKTYLWFLPVLFTIQILFILFKTKKPFLLFLIFLNLFSIILLEVNLIPFNLPHLNFCNWIGYFSIGFWLKNFRYEQVSSKVINPILCLILLTIFISLKLKPSYFKINSLLFILLMSFLVIKFSFYFQDNKIIKIIGRQSLFVYLFHMPFAGFFYFKFNQINNKFVYISPIIILCIVVLIMVLIIKSLDLIFSRCPKFKLMGKIFGLKVSN